MSVQHVPGGVVHELPADLLTALIANPTALDAWKDITPLARNEFICWVEDAKQQTTRDRRIRRTQEEWSKASAAPAAGQVASIANAPASSSQHGSVSPNEQSPRRRVLLLVQWGSRSARRATKPGGASRI